MMNRRHILQAAAGLATLPLLATAARADWKADYPELVFATIPDENATGVEKRYEPFIQYLSKMLGVPVKLRIANDYAAVIEGQIAGNIHLAKYGPASFARALMNGAKIDAFAMEVNKDGTKGYYSVLYVKKDSPIQKIEDLKGKLSTEIVRSVHWSDMADEHKDMITKWTDAFDKIYQRQTGLDGTQRAGSLDQAARLSELEQLVRDHKIAERMAQIKADIEAALGA